MSCFFWSPSPFYLMDWYCGMWSFSWQIPSSLSWTYPLQVVLLVDGPNPAKPVKTTKKYVVLPSLLYHRFFIHPKKVFCFFSGDVCFKAPHPPVPPTASSRAPPTMQPSSGGLPARPAETLPGDFGGQVTPQKVINYKGISPPQKKNPPQKNQV